MPDQPVPSEETIRARAIGAAMAVFRRATHTPPPQQVVEEAFDAASIVFAAYEDVLVTQMLADCKWLGTEPIDNGTQHKIKLAARLATAHVSAFDALCQQPDCENYIETDITITDPDSPRKYLLTIVKPGGSTPHQLHMQAKRELDTLRQAACRNKEHVAVVTAALEATERQRDELRAQLDAARADDDAS